MDRIVEVEKRVEVPVDRIVQVNTTTCLTLSRLSAARPLSVPDFESCTDCVSQPTDSSPLLLCLLKVGVADSCRADCGAGGSSTSRENN